VSQTQQQAFLAGLFVMMPGILLSGIMTPIDSMPRWLQPATRTRCDGSARSCARS
jgi:ABC-2 type transport system permease protein